MSPKAAQTAFTFQSADEVQPSLPPQTTPTATVLQTEFPGLLERMWVETVDSTREYALTVYWTGDHWDYTDGAVGTVDSVTQPDSPADATHEIRVHTHPPTQNLLKEFSADDFIASGKVPGPDGVTGTYSRTLRARAVLVPTTEQPPDPTQCILKVMERNQRAVEMRAGEVEQLYTLLDAAHTSNDDPDETRATMRQFLAPYVVCTEAHLDI